MSDRAYIATKYGASLTLSPEAVDATDFLPARHMAAKFQVSVAVAAWISAKPWSAPWWWRRRALFPLAARHFGTTLDKLA